MRKWKNQSGFTLIEMLIVLLIITILIILLLPNLTARSKDVYDKGCDALVATVQGQIYAYQLDKGKLPTSLDDLVTEKYIEIEHKKCSDGTSLSYDVSDGKISTRK